MHADPDTIHRASATVTYGAAGAGTYFGFTAYELAAWVSIAIALLSFIVNVAINLYYKRKHYKLAEEQTRNRQSGGAKVQAMATAFVLSAVGAGFIATHEGFRTDAYLDPVGIPTICFGSTAGVKLGQRATFDECNRMLRRDAGIAGRAVAKCTYVLITQAQYDALVSFVYNVGGDAYCRSTLARKLNEGDCWAAAAQFDRWVHAGGRQLPGLVKRRAEERKMFETGCQKDLV